MWFDILKNQELTTSQLGATMDWENEVIPDKEDDECRKIIMGMMDRAKRYEDGWHGFIYVLLQLRGTISEESACRALEEFKNIDKTSTPLIIDEGLIRLDKNGRYRSVIIEDYQGNIYFSGFAISEGHPYLRISVIVKTDVRHDKELIEDEYQKVCEYIFGEYYNTDFKIE